jgi:energy-coupling factor transporter ATP-binding protein EcfA2
MNEIITLRVGSRGCGKSEYSRQMLGLTPDEYTQYQKNLERLLKTEREEREMMRKILGRF